MCNLITEMASAYRPRFLPRLSCTPTHYFLVGLENPRAALSPLGVYNEQATAECLSGKSECSSIFLTGLSPAALSGRQMRCPFQLSDDKMSCSLPSIQRHGTSSGLSRTWGVGKDLDIWALPTTMSTFTSPVPVGSSRTRPGDASTGPGWENEGGVVAEPSLSNLRAGYPLISTWQMSQGLHSPDAAAASQPLSLFPSPKAEGPFEPVLRSCLSSAQCPRLCCVLRTPFIFQS